MIMSETFHIISDGSCDLPTGLVQKENITVVPFYVSFDDGHYLKEGVEIGIRDFYRQMVSEVNRTQVDPEEVLSFNLYRYDREKAEIETIV